MRQTYPTTTAQSGQAMTEFLVSMTMVMSVLLLAIVMLGKFNDVRNRALMSSRYVAWERTVWTDDDLEKNLAADPSTTEGWSTLYGSAASRVTKDDTELKAEVIQRLMAGDNAPISSTDRKQAQLSVSQPAMWRDYGGHPLLASVNDVAVGTNVAADPSSAQSSAALARWAVPTDTAEPYVAHLSLPTSTLQSGSVSISVAQHSAVLKRLWPKDDGLPAFSGLTFSDTNVLMSNTWVPDGAASNEQLFSQAVPAANVALVPSSGYLALARYAPEISTLEFGRIQPDVVPPGRLSQ